MAASSTLATAVASAARIIRLILPSSIFLSLCFSGQHLRDWVCMGHRFIGLTSCMDDRKRRATHAPSGSTIGSARSALLGTSVNKGRKRAGDREVPSPLPLLDRPYGFCPGGALPAGFWFSSTCVRFTF